MIELSDANLASYVIESVLPALGKPTANIVRAEEVHEETYVNWIFRVDLSDAAGENTVYLRQSRNRVKMKPTMAMDPGRIGFEVQILQLIDRLVPGIVPQVLYWDRENSVAVLSDIKRNGRLLVRELEAGRPHPETGPYFGTKIGRLHVATRGITHDLVRGSSEKNDQAKAFHLGMRTRPALEMFPDAAMRLLAVSDLAPECLVLGDLASKNIFVEGDVVRFLDLERAFVGDPAFDVTFLFAHYLLEVPAETLHQSVAFVRAFLNSYMKTVGGALSQGERDQLGNRIVRFMGLNLLYRLYGFYLAVQVQQDREYWRAVAHTMISDEESADLPNILDRLDLSGARRT